MEAVSDAMIGLDPATEPTDAGVNSEGAFAREAKVVTLIVSCLLRHYVSLSTPYR